MRPINGGFIHSFILVPERLCALTQVVKLAPLVASDSSVVQSRRVKPRIVSVLLDINQLTLLTGFQTLCYFLYDSCKLQIESRQKIDSDTKKAFLT